MVLPSNFEKKWALVVFLTVGSSWAGKVLGMEFEFFILNHGPEIFRFSKYI